MLRFSIRDVLWLMVVVGILCAWWYEDGRKYGAYRELYGGKASFKVQLDKLSRQARSDPALKADVEELKATAWRQLSEDVAERMRVARKVRELKEKASKLPPPAPSLFDEWPPVPPWEQK